MNPTEIHLIEAINNLFKNKESNLGLVKKPTKETSHGFQFQWEGLNDAFSLKMTDSPFHESVSSAFRDIHSYRFVSDPVFTVSFEKRMTSMGVPINERQKAIKAIDEVKKEWKIGEEFDEGYAGWHPQLDEITDMTLNATDRDYKTTNPHAGGGPAPAKNKETTTESIKKISEDIGPIEICPNCEQTPCQCPGGNGPGLGTPGELVGKDPRYPDAEMSNGDCCPGCGEEICSCDPMENPNRPKPKEPDFENFNFKPDTRTPEEIERDWMLSRGA